MEPERPEATAVAVADGRIRAVGDLASVRAELGADAEAFAVDRRFQDLVLLPGFIDPHIHPSLAAIISTKEIEP